MESLEWYPVFYNGIETNVEVTKCGKIRKIKVDWYGKNSGSYKIKYGEVNFNEMKLSFGYESVKIQVKELKPKTVQVHQLVAAAFLGYKFESGKKVVDHIDSDKRNNSIYNLKVVSPRENLSKERTIKSGLPVGVCKHGKSNKFKSQIYFNKKNMYLGLFNTIQEASNAYQQKLKSLT